jgi:hypothetical protein
MDIAIEALLKSQDQLVTRQQALSFMTQAEITARLGRYWQVILPGVYATFTGGLTARHRRRAALLHAGSGSLLSDLYALEGARIGTAGLRRPVALRLAALSSSGVLPARARRLPCNARPRTGSPSAPYPRALLDVYRIDYLPADPFARVLVADAVQISSRDDRVAGQ